MADWIFLIVILLFALVLLLIEIILIPGTTWFGIAGMLIAAVGIYISFRQLGNTIGTVILFSFVLVCLGATWYGLRNNVWKKFALNDSIDSKVNDEVPVLLQIGELGKTTSQLKPMGKAEFEGRFWEVRSLGIFIDVDVLVKVVKVEHTKIYVEIV